MIVDPDFCDHWKTRMLVGLLDGDEAAPVYVLRLWAHCQNRRQDRFPNLSPEALKALCRFPGDAAKLLAALVETGFVRRDGRDLVASNWSEYNASLIAAWKNGTRGGRPPKGLQNAPPEPTVYPEETHGLPTGKPTGSRLDESREEKNIHPPTPTAPLKREEKKDSAAPSNANASLPTEAEWTEITRVLRSLGVGDPARAIVGARDGGASPEDVLAVIAHYRGSPGAWSPALLSGRVARCAPGLAASEFWPPKAATASRAPPRQTAAQRQDADDCEAMRIVRDGRRHKKTDEQIQAELVSARLGESSDRLGWRTESEAMTK